LFPTQLTSPMCQKLHVYLGQVMFATAPWDFFHYDSTPAAVHTPHAVEEKHQKAPQRNELKPSLVEVIVAGAGLLTTQVHCSRTAPRSQPHFDGSFVRRELGPFVDESWEAMAVVAPKIN